MKRFLLSFGVVLLFAMGLLLASLPQDMPVSVNAGSGYTPTQAEIDRAIEIIKYAKYSHEYWYKRLEWDMTTDTALVGDREYQLHWIQAYDEVLTALYGANNITYYGGYK